MDEAVDWAIKENLLDGLISSEKDEVIGMILTEFDDEAFMKTCQEDGYANGLRDGEQEKAVETVRNLLKKNISQEIIAECTGLPLEEVKKLQAELLVTV